MRTHRRQRRLVDSVPLRTASNATLLEGCADGDAASWRALVDRYERLVYAIARREGLSYEQAADATQDTFASLLKSIEAIDDPERLASWLMTVARRTSWRLRQAGRPDPAPATSRATEADPAEDLAVALWVYEAVELLEEPCRTLVQSLFFDPHEPTYSEVAVRIGRPLGSVGPLRARCLMHLRHLLEDDL